MRIIDKNTDFYDYLQNVYHDTSLTFDRTDSFVLTKELMCDYLYFRRRYVRLSSLDKFSFCLLQIGNTFWLFLIEVTEISDLDRPTDYKIDLLETWKNFDKPRVLTKLELIEFSYSIEYQLTIKEGYLRSGFNTEKIFNKTDMLIKAVDTNDYRITKEIKEHTVYVGGNEKVVKHIPLFKACGIANCVDPLDMYLAYEEYFSLEKTASERRDPIGTTDKDRVESHGFDLKTSFRKS